MINRYCNNFQQQITRILVPGILFLATACNNTTEDIRALTGPGRQYDHATDVTIIHSKNGTIKMRLFAHDFLHNTMALPPYIDMNVRLKVEFFDDSGKLENVVTADSCRYYEAENNIIVWDSVEITSSKGQRLNTEELIWNERAGKFFTEQPVTITTPTEILYGIGMEANRDFSWYHILQPKGSIQVKKGEVPQ